MKILIFEMRNDPKWTETVNVRCWHSKIENFLMGQKVLKIANAINHEPDASISYTASTTPMFMDSREHERTQKAQRNLRVRE